MSAPKSIQEALDAGFVQLPNGEYAKLKARAKSEADRDERLRFIAIIPDHPDKDTENRSKSLVGPLPAQGGPSKRVRQSSKPLLNRLESEWFLLLKESYHGYIIHSQAQTFKLANGLKYTPDFTATIDLSPGGKTQIAWEVKGKWVDGDSFPKLKMAASVWPEIRWLLVWKDKEGQWQEQNILA